jgi:HD-GYP domain-containing protein (c-di-GMP phosphodiesterase class II)
MLHDIGKIGIPGEILNKPGPVTDPEWEVIKSQPDVGYRVC